MIQSFINGSNIVAVGSAGTGKTYLALYLALKDVIESKLHSKIIIVRSNVPTRNSGFLPGSLEEKNEIYALPFRQITNTLCENGSAWDILSKKKIIEFVSTSYIRGLTFDDSIVIVEEVQNLDAEEIKTVLTRAGENTQLVICGDSKQGDLFRSREKSGFELLMYIADNMPGHIDLINFLPRDIVRSGFVKKLLLLLEDSKFDSL
jgi:phosphate starvation-inducible PhoH-like protein